MTDYSFVAKQRILATSCLLFLQNGFEKTTLADIAGQLNVDVSFVEEQYSCSDDVLRTIIDSLLEDIGLILIAFVHKEFSPLLREEKVKIYKDRLRFQDEALAKEFVGRITDHLAAVLDYLVVHQREFRVAMYAAMTMDRYARIIDQLQLLFLPTDENPLYNNYPMVGRPMGKTKLNRRAFLQSNVDPLIIHAGFRTIPSDDNTSDEEIRRCKETISLIEQHNMRFVCGKDILFMHI